MKKKHCRRVFFLFLLVSFIWSQSVIGMFKPLLFKGGNTKGIYDKNVGVGAVEYKRKTKTGKYKVIAIVILDGGEEASYPLNKKPHDRYTEHRKVLLDLVPKKNIRYIYIAPHPLKPDSLVFHELSYLGKLNKRQIKCKLATINFIHWYNNWYNEEDDSMCISLMLKDHYYSIHEIFLNLKFEKKREIPILTPEKTTKKTDHLKVCSTLEVLPVTPFQLKEFLLNLHDCCGMCAKKIKSQDDKIRCQGKCEFAGYCSNECLKEAYEKGHKSYCAAEKEKDDCA
jgi:hypothetical protein